MIHDPSELGGTPKGDTLRNVVETIAAPSRLFKAEIVRRTDGHLQVFLLRWIEEIVPGHGKVAASGKTRTEWHPSQMIWRSRDL